MNSRRELIATLGVVAVAGCTAQGGAQSGQNESTEGTGGENNEPQRDLNSDQELHRTLVNGEDGELLEEAKDSIDFEAIDDALENGGDRFESVANAFETASKQYTEPVDNYWERHQVITSAVLHQIDKKVVQEEKDEWDFRIDTRLDATPSNDGWLKYSHINGETSEETENGNTKYQTIRAQLTDDWDHTTYIEGENVTQQDPFIKQLLASITDPETYDSASLIDDDALDNAIEENNLNKEGSYDQAGINIGILLGGGIDIKEEGPTAIVPEYLLMAEDDREEEILEIIDEYQDKGDIALQDRLRRHYFGNDLNQYEGTVTNVTDQGQIEYMEGVNDVDLGERIANT